MIEVDRAANLDGLPDGGVATYLNSASRILSNATRGAGIYVYYILQNEALPVPDFDQNDTKDQAKTKQRAYLKAERGDASLPTVVQESMLKYFTHAVMLSDVPAIHRFGDGFTYAETTTADRNERGVYFLTKRVADNAATLQLPAGGYGGCVIANEFLHMVISPQLNTATWDGGEHLIGNLEVSP